MRRPVGFAVAVLAVMTLAACGSDTPSIPLTPTDADVTGSFNLSTANGQAPPYALFQTNTERWSLATDRMVIAANNTYADTTTYTVVKIADGTASTQTTTSAGTYQIANNKINFTTTVNGDNTFTGSVNGNTLVLLYQTGRFVYSR